MKRMVSLVATMTCLVPAHTLIASTQPVNAAPSEANLATRTAIENATKKMTSALMRGDAKSVSQLLAPSFELGRHQYRKLDAAWMRQALPRQLELAKFTAFTVEVSSVKVTGGRAVVLGRMDATAFLISGEKGGNVSGGYGAIWVETKSGWRLERSDLTFDTLLQLLVPNELPAPIRSSDAPADRAAAPRDNPSLVLEQPNRGEVESMAFSPEGNVLATNGSYDGIHFSSPRSGAFQKAMPTPMSVKSMTYAPDSILITGHNDGKVRLWNVQNGALQRELSASTWNVDAVRVSPDGRTLAVDGDTGVQLWEIASGIKVRTLGQTNDVSNLDFSRDGKTVASATGRNIELWDVKDGTLVQTIENEQWGGFLPDGKTMITIRSGPEGHLRFRTLGSATVTREIEIPNPLRKPRQRSTGTFISASGLVYFPSALIAPNGRVAASIYEDGSIGLWDTQSGNVQRILRGFQDNVTGGGISMLAFSPDSEALAVASRSGETAVWKVSPSKFPHISPKT